MERRLERGQGLRRCIRARAFIHFERDFHPFGLAAVGSGETHRHGNDFFLESSRRDRGQRLLMALVRKFVALLAGYAVALGQPLRRQSHGKIGVGIVVDQPRIGAHLVAAHGNHGHRFGASGHNHFCATAANPLRSQRNRLQS